MRNGLLAFLAILALPFAAAATGVPPDSWTGAGPDNNWDTGANWSAAEPAAGAIVQITDPTLQSLVDFQNPLPGTLASVTVDGGMTLQQGQDTLATNSLTIGNTGTYTLTGGTLQAGSVTVTGNGTINFGQVSASYTANAGQVDLGAGGTGTATINQVGGTVNDDMIVGDSTNGSYTNNNGTHNVTGNLILGNQAGVTGAYTITGASAQTNVNFNTSAETPNGALIVGNAGIGNFTQETSAGSDATPTVSVAGDLVLGLQGLGSGQSTDSQGTYTLNDGTLTVGGKVVVGAGSTGTNGANTFTQNGGALSITGSASGNSNYVGVGNSNGTGELFIGGGGANIDNGTGTYNLSNGTLSASVIEAGHSGTGIMNQAGGSANASFALWVGNATGSNGTYNLSGGNLTAANEQIGIFGTGALNQTGGTNTTPNQLAVGNGAGSGTASQTGGITTVGAWFAGQILANGSTVPGTAGGPGIIGTLTVGAQTATGLYQLGTTGQSNTTTWGGYPSTPATPPPAFDSVNNAPYLQVYGNVVIGADAGSTGTFQLAGDGSALQINNVVGFSNQGTMVVGASGNGTFTQTDATSVYLDGSVAIGLNQTGVGTYTLNAGDSAAGGSLSIGGDLEIGGSDHVGDPVAQTTTGAGNGTFTQNAGTVTVQGNLDLATNSGAVGNYNLNGGSLTVNNVGRFGNNGGTGTFTQAGGTAQFGTPTNSGGLQLGTTPLSGPAGTGTYTITGSSSVLNIYGNGDLGVATNTTGTLNIGNGSDSPTVNVFSTGAGDGNLTIGDAGSGNLNLNSGTLSVANTVQIGVNGVGTVMQTGGTFDTGFLDLSQPAGSGSSTYTMTGGAINVTSDLNVGGLGTGPAAFTQNGAGTTVNVGGTLFINGGGTYNLMAGTLNDDLIVGDVSTGTFNNTGGAHNVTGNAILGNTASGIGFYNLNSGGMLNVSAHAAGDGTGNLIVGNSGQGTYTQGLSNQSDASSGNLANVGNNMILGNQAGSTGTAAIWNGTLNIGTDTSQAVNGNYGSPAESLVIGNNGTGAGTFTQNGGNITIGGDATASSMNVAVQDLILGADTGSSGTYKMNAGTLTVYGNSSFNNSAIEIGFINGSLTGGGTGSFVQTGGTVTTYGVNGLAIGDCTACGASGEYDISAGSLSLLANPTTPFNFFDSNSSGNLFIGAHEQGKLVQTGGSVSVAGDAFVGFDNGASGTWTINASAGTPSVSVSGDMYVGGTTLFGGLNGTGEVDQSAGTTTVAGSLTVGSGAQSTGTYNLTGDSGLNVGSFTTIGGQGTGTFLNDASIHTTHDLVLGVAGGSHGTYTLQDDGTLTVGTAGSPGFFDVGEHGTGTFNQSRGATTIFGPIDLGRCGGTGCLGAGDTDSGVGNGTVNLTGGALSVSLFGVVGDAGIGVFNQSGNSTVTIGTELDVGRNGGSGTYNLGGANPADASSLTVTSGVLTIGSFGPGGSGTFNQADATTVSVKAGDVVVGDLAGVTGAYNLSGTGSLTISGTLYVGAAGTGTFSQSGTATVSAASVDIGTDTGGTGTYKLSGGTLTNAGILYIGASGSGDLQQSGGAITATGLSMGNNTGGSGTYELSGGTVTISGTSYLGGASGAQGVVTQTGGTAKLQGNVILGNTGGSEGQYSLLGSSGASLTVGGNLDIAAAAGSSGSFYYNYDVKTSTPGGNATLAFSNSGSKLLVGDQGVGVFWQGGGDLNLAAQGVTLDIGVNPGSTGTYNLVAGTLEDDQIVGDAGNGAFNNSGGTHTVNGNLIVGNQSTGIGTYTLGGTGSLVLATSGAEIILGNAAGAQGTFNYNTTAGDTGAITFNSGTGQQMIVGLNGHGTFNQGGQDLNLNGAGVTLDIAQKSGSTGTYNLNGGSLETFGGLKVGDGGTGQFTENGGAATINGSLVIASQSSSTGSQVNLTNGTLNASAVTVGDAGTGFYNQSGGTATISGNLVLGNQAGSSGDLSVGGSGSPSLTVGGNATVGNNGFGSFNEGAGGSIDVKGSMTIATTSAGGGAAIEGGSLTIGDGGAGNQLLITANGSMKIEDTNNVGASVTVDGALVNNGQLALGLHDVATPATLTVTNGLQNNGLFNFEANSVLNANVTNGSLSNNTALFTAQNGATTNVTLNGNMSNYAVVNVSELGLSPSAFTQNGTFTNNAGGTFQVTDGVVTINGGTGDSLDNSGTVTIKNDPNGGTTPPFQPSAVALNGNVTNASGANINVQASTVTMTGNGNGNPALDNFGTIGIGNDPAHPALGSNVTVTGDVKNESGASMTLTSSAITVNGNTTNAGTITLTNSTAHWNGTFTNNGAYISDPSTSHFIDLNIGATGYLQGGTGDVFDVTGNLTSTSTQNTLWKTAAAELEFSSGTSTSHLLDITGLDVGPSASGFSDNFAWGLLDIDSGNSVSLMGLAGVNALYVSALDGLAISGNDITNLFGDGLNIYYDPNVDTALGDQSYALADGGVLCPVGSDCSLSPPPPSNVPEPGSLALFGAGLAGLGFLRRRRNHDPGDVPSHR